MLQALWLFLNNHYFNKAYLYDPLKFVYDIGPGTSSTQEQLKER